MSPSRFHARQRLQHACALDDQSSCPRTSPHRLTPREIFAIKEMVTAVEYRHVPTGTLAILAQRHQGLGIALDLVSPRAQARLASAPAPRTPG
jgi:hypothetical protein